MSLVSSSVSVGASVATYNYAQTHAKNATSDDAVSIGDLTEAGVVVTVTDNGSTANTAVSSSFSANTGDVVSLSMAFDNTVDQTSTRFQLYDSSGNVIADNQGTTAQQTAYTEWVNGTLAMTADDTYTAVATPQNGVAATLSTYENQGTAIFVNSQLTGSSTAEYYNFTLTAGNDIKMDFDAGTKSSLMRVQILDSSGNVVADNFGNAYQKTKFNEMTSATGMEAEAGDYSIVVSYADGVDATQDVDYNFKLYSGSTYSVVYNTDATAQTYDPSALGSVEAADEYESLKATRYHKVDEKAATGVNIGWLKEDVSALQVLSQLTSLNSNQYYTFTLQKGSNLKFDFDSTTTTDRSAIRVQLYDKTGTRIIADSEGTKAQRDMYEKLTSSTGITVDDAQSYVLKMTYASDVKYKRDTNYKFYVMSGTTYSALYKTTASAQTYANAVLNGNYKASYSTASGLAAYLSGSSDSSDSLFAALKLTV